MVSLRFTSQVIRLSQTNMSNAQVIISKLDHYKMPLAFIFLIWDASWKQTFMSFPINYIFILVSIGFKMVLTCGPFCKHGLALLLACISNFNYIYYNVRDGITYPFPNFNGAPVEVWEWRCNFIANFRGKVILSMLGLKLTRIGKRY